MGQIANEKVVQLVQRISPRKRLAYAALVLAVVVLIPLLTPRCLYIKDGGSKIYKAPLYTVTKLHRILPVSEQTKSEFEEGTIVTLFGLEVYNSTK